MPNDTAPNTLPVPVTISGEREAFELALRQAKVYAASTIVPETYRDHLPNCLIAMNMARRIGADILQTMQSLNIIHGRPGWSAQFLIATFNQCGKFSAMRYEWKGEPNTPEWGCRAWAIEKATKERINGPWVTLELVKKEGWYDRKDKSGSFISKWRTMPELMFHYRAGSFFVKTHAPELAMGLPTAEELYDQIIDITPTGSEPALAVVANGDAITRAKDDVAAILKAQPTSKTEATEKLVMGTPIPSPPLDLTGGPNFADIVSALRAAKTPEDIVMAEDLARSMELSEAQSAELVIEVAAAMKRLAKP